MTEKHRLRLNRAGTILNLTSRQQETTLGKALKGATAQLLDEVVQGRKQEVLAEVGRRSIHYYLAKYGEDHFAKAAG